MSDDVVQEKDKRIAELEKSLAEAIRVDKMHQKMYRTRQCVAIDKAEQALEQCEKVEEEGLLDDIEQAIADTHDIDTQDKHYAKAVVDHLIEKGILR